MGQTYKKMELSFFPGKQWLLLRPQGGGLWENIIEGQLPHNCHPLPGCPSPSSPTPTPSPQAPLSLSSREAGPACPRQRADCPFPQEVWPVFICSQAQRLQLTKQP